MALGFIEMTLAENFCNGIPLGSNVAGVVDYTSDEFKSRTNAEVYDVALTHIDSALAILGSATDVNTVAVRNATLITKARILVNKGQYAAGRGARARERDPVQLPVCLHHTGLQQQRRSWHLDTEQLRGAHDGG
jgi:hypothetical protein